MELTWDQILNLLQVRQAVKTDAEWDEAKMKAIESTIDAIIDKLSRALPDPETK